MINFISRLITKSVEPDLKAPDKHCKTYDQAQAVELFANHAKAIAISNGTYRNRTTRISNPAHVWK